MIPEEERGLKVWAGLWCGAAWMDCPPVGRGMELAAGGTPAVPGKRGASRPFSPIGAQEPKGPSTRQRSKSNVSPWDRRRPAGS
jgi:hypothetical protein